MGTVKRSYQADEERINKDTKVRDEWRRIISGKLEEGDELIAFERGLRAGADQQIGEYSIPDNTAVVKKKSGGIRVHAFELKALRWKQNDTTKKLADALLGDVGLLETAEYAKASDLFTIVLEVAPTPPDSINDQVESLKKLLEGKGIGLWLLKIEDRDTEPCTNPAITVVLEAKDRNEKKPDGSAYDLLPQEVRRREVLFKNVSPPWVTEALAKHPSKSTAAAAQGNLRRFLLAKHGKGYSFDWQTCSKDDAKKLVEDWKSEGESFVTRLMKDPSTANAGTVASKFSHVKTALDYLLTSD
jgi:hypothetical protein